jgi:monovalent cation:H+ antiporter-2, CPA2 family
MHESEPILGIAVLLAAALVGGMIAHRLRQPIILGFLAIGVVVGPHSFCLFYDLPIVETIATIGVALLMFTLGLEISIAQLREVGKIGMWGGIAQIVFSFSLGLAAGNVLFHWPLIQSIVFGLIISLSSTAVCLKILMERGELNSVHGRIMIAVLILQDISVILMVVIMPLIGGQEQNIYLALGLAVGKAALFVGVTVVSGIWVLPWLMGRVGGLRSRELFLLTILVLCLGAAVGTQILGLSMVFGAFLIGLMLRGPRFGYQALAEITPLRDIFATLFFISLGMLVDPRFVLDNWQMVAFAVFIIIFIKMLVVFTIVRLFGFSNRIALLSGAGLFQLGEFGFIVAQSGLSARAISEQFYSLILSSAIISMMLTPLFMSIVTRIYSKASATSKKEIAPREVAEAASETPERVIIAGYGRIGKNVVQGVHDADLPYTVIEIDPNLIGQLRKSGRPRIHGDASNVHVLERAGLKKARTLVLTFPDSLGVINAVKVALEINPNLHIVARVHTARQAQILKEMGITELINPEYEASLEFLERTLAESGWTRTRIKRTLPVVQQDEEFIEFDPDEGV